MDRATFLAKRALELQKKAASPWPHESDPTVVEQKHTAAIAQGEFDRKQRAQQTQEAMKKLLLDVEYKKGQAEGLKKQIQAAHKAGVVSHGKSEHQEMLEQKREEEKAAKAEEAPANATPEAPATNPPASPGNLEPVLEGMPKAASDAEKKEILNPTPGPEKDIQPEEEKPAMPTVKIQPQEQNITRVAANGQFKGSGIGKTAAADPAVESAPENKDITKPEPSEDLEQTETIHPTVMNALSMQVGTEFYAAYTYFGASGWFELKGLDGFAKLAKLQANGEIEHAMMVFDHLITAGCPAKLPALDRPILNEYQTVLQVCETILAHEKSVTNNWRLIYAASQETGDGATAGLAQWFLKEQLEEENMAATLCDKVKLANGGAGILTIDASLK